jgi:cytochrome c oxidase assembly protein subunit 15
MGLATAIFAYMVWLIFELRFGVSGPRPVESRQGRRGRWSLLLAALVFLMILSGALVAGTDAGFAYSTWPLMGESFIPPGLYATSPAWMAMFEDITTIQFNHRMFAYFLFVVINVAALIAYRGAAHPRVKLAAVLVVLALSVQVILGISTLLLHVPVVLGTAHQGGAVLLLTAVLFLSHVQLRQ